MSYMDYFLLKRGGGGGVCVCGGGGGAVTGGTVNSFWSFQWVLLKLCSYIMDLYKMCI